VEHESSAEGAPKQVSMTLAEFRRVVATQEQEAAATKDEGNRLFQSGEVEAAEDKYHSALEMADAILKVPASNRLDFADLRARLEAVRVTSFLNLAACALKEKRWEDAVGFCQDALKSDAKNVKALYRLGQGYLGLSQLEDAVDTLAEAERLDPQNKDLEKLLRRARREAKQADERAKKSFGGMFARSTYKGMRDMTLEAEEQVKQKERTRLADALKDRASHTEASLLFRWASSGMIALETEERKALEALVRRVAAAGGLDSADLREGFQVHGLEAAFRVEKEELEEDQLKRYQEQQLLAEVKRITAKAQQRHALTPEEQKTIRDYKEEEIERLREKHRTEGLTQDERYLLDKLKETIAQENQFSDYMVGVEDKIGEAMRKLNSGVHMGPKERFNMYKMLEEEEKRLEALDDEHGLSTTQLKQLKQLRSLRQDRAEQKKNKKAQHDYMKLMSDGF